MPMPQFSVKRIFLTPISSVRNLMTFSASGEPAFHRRRHRCPSEFSRKITMSTSPGFFTGLGTLRTSVPGAGRRQIELLAQGHVQGADAATDRGGQRALDGNHVVAYGVQGFLGQPGVLVIDLGGLLAGVDFHPGDLRSPLYAFSTAASTTLIATGLISTPMPSPSMNGMIGFFGTLKDMSAFTVILSPVAGTWIFGIPC